MDDGRSEPGRGQADAGGKPDGPGAAWLNTEHSAALRALVQRYLAGDRQLSDEVRNLSTSFCTCARAQGQSAEGLLIAMRVLWRDLGLTHGDRLQAATLYDQLVRRSIERFYERPD